MSRRRLWAVALAGLLASASCVRSAAGFQATGGRRLLGSWWSWTTRWGAVHPLRGSSTHAGVRFLVAALALSACWVCCAWLIHRQGHGARAAAAIAALWALPVALAPPLLSRDAYAYLAQGAVGEHGGSFYRSPAAVLAPSSTLLHAVDPMYRAHLSPYGPVATHLFAACLAVGGHGWPALVVLRVVVVLSLIVTVWCGYRLAPRSHRSLVVWLLAGSPLVLLHLVGGLHLEAIEVALLALALVLQRGGRSSWAVGLVVVAAAVKVTAVVALPALLLGSWHAGGWRRVGRDAAAALGTGVGLALLLGPDPFGWLPALSGTTAVWNPISPATLLALSWATLTGSSPVSPLHTIRVICLALGAMGALAICVTARRRSTAATAGYLLAVATVAAPTLWPWYAVPAVVCLLLAAEPRPIVLATALTLAAVLTDLPMPVVGLQRVSAVAELAAVVGLVVVGARGARRPALVVGSTAGARDGLSVVGSEGDAQGVVLGDVQRGERTHLDA